MDDVAADDHADKDQRERGILRDALQTGCTVGEVRADDGVDIRQDDTDDLAEAQGDDGQIVAAQTQRRDADDDAEDPGHDRADEQCQQDVRDRSARVAGLEQLLHRHGLHEDAAGVSADRHEACMA